MPKCDLVIESGVIKCEHGGQVLLKSSEAVHVLNGKKPMHDIDLLNAPISGCTHNVTHGGQCTKVVAITSAVTEDNVSAAGKKYLLRVDGCQTDKGAALVLQDPGQTVHKIHVKANADTDAIKTDPLEDAKTTSKEDIKKEKYRIYPLRHSGENVRALRATREFQLLKEFYATSDSYYTHDKIVTKQDAYLYVTADEKTTEYKVLNRGDIFNPKIEDVVFKDTATNILRKYIPYYKEHGKMEFLYSNVKLNAKERANFKAFKLTVEDTKNPYTANPKEYSKKIKHSAKEFPKLLLSRKGAEALGKPHKNILISLDDPVGEVQKLKDEQLHLKTYLPKSFAHARKTQKMS
jgi:hypothetical protein